MTESARITEWLERDLGGRVIRIERQARWRPAWWVDLEREGGLLPLALSPSAAPGADARRSRRFLDHQAP
jgi:hypothetical protein